MIYLTAPPSPARVDAYRRAGLGIMLTPNMGNRPEVAGRAPTWAADNGCFTRGDTYDHAEYLAWLDARHPWRRSCLFATAPDVVGDAAATWARSCSTFIDLRARCYAPALVAQDGLELHGPSWDEADRWDVLFVGGSTTWKLSQDAADCVHEARLLGKRIHVGRVNTRGRLKIARQLDADSCDGTTVAISPANLAPVVGWLDHLNGPDYAEPLTLAPSWELGA